MADTKGKAAVAQAAGKSVKRFEAAKAAMAGMLALKEDAFADHREPDFIARMSVAYADALLEELEK